MDFTISHIASVTGGLIIGDADLNVSNVLIDSRKKFTSKHTLFVAISGIQHDGHHYIESLIDQGITMFLVEKIPTNLEHLNVTWVVVLDTLVALQQLAANHRESFRYPVVGITGSNGKTIVKEWAYQILHRHFNIVRSPKSYNSQVGVPLSVLNMDSQHDLAIFEAGISQPEEMKALENIIKPNVGIFTNIGDAHAKGFESLKNKIQQKLLLFQRSDVLIYRKDNEAYRHEIEEFANTHQVKLFSWSFETGADVRVTQKANGELTILHLTKSEGKFELILPFNDSASIENAIHVWMLTQYLNILPTEVQQAFTRLTPIQMRLNQKAGINNCILISDFYNNDLLSLEIALNWSERQHRGNQKTIILSDIEQSDLPDDTLYKNVNHLLHQHQYDQLIGIGQRISKHQKIFDLVNLQFYPSTTHFLELLQNQQFNNETILLKGGRSFKFELIEKRLQRQVHNTVLEINLNALHHNLNYFKSKLKPSTKLMVMVKAYSYGSGGHEIAHFLQYHGVDYLAVAYADEGITLRNDGIKTPIMVMNSDSDSYDQMIAHNLEPEIFSFKSLEMLIEVLHQHPKTQCNVHLEYNSGMNRLGFDDADFEQLTSILKTNKQLKIASVFSHLASSDMPEMNDYTLRQIAAFEMFYDKISDALNIQPLKHILNSTGIIHNSEAQFDMVRLGIGLYGVDPSLQEVEHLQQVGTLWSTISQIRNVSANDGVGYGKHSAHNSSRKIAVVAIGYADGLNRGLSQGKGHFNIHGQNAPIVGNICMDMTMCDVTNIDCKEGDAVQVFGSTPTIYELAKKINTIPYEILTSVSQRVKRIFTEE